MTKLDKLQEKLNKIDAMIEEIDASKKELAIEKKQVIEETEKAFEEELPSNKICKIESLEMAQKALELSDYQMDTLNISIVGSHVVAIPSWEYGWRPAIEIRKEHYRLNSGRTNTVVFESQDGRRSGSYETASTSGQGELNTTFERICPYLFPKFTVFAKKIGESIDQAKKELEPIRVKRIIEIQEQYQDAINDLEKRRVKIIEIKQPILKEVISLENEGKIICSW